ncbi:G-type lectin S-receptor-like serine/threonine-protein kinase At4g27290 isoform X1 [Zingiber officinale]|uniref:G-type lectin S-receptor-like serine/threonine-protein kinase At4g27290 isoform X1 n=1 Tax=Zingiber officinale TaxID=94328 RepID=UPI001C4C8891|nr:G-type lectin S-receptor-like serine/threonine-protein kinase At4g27290 isoform X1 [Zingiber officinale]
MLSEAESMARRIPFLLYTLFNLTPALFSLSYAGDTLTPAQPLLDAAGATLISEGGNFELGFFSPAGSSNRYVGMWFGNVSQQTVVWVANRNRPITDGSGLLLLTANGTLVVSNNSSVVLWSSSSPGLSSPMAQLLDSGNLVVREAGDVGSSRYAWQSFDFPTHTLLPGMKLGWNLTSRRNRILTAWTSSSDPAEGNYTFGIDLRGDPQIIGWVGTRQYLRNGPWNGLYFSGVPEMMSSDMLDYSFVIDGEQVVYSYTVRDPSLIRQVVINPTSGAIEGLLWTKDSQSWSTRAAVPRDTCDRIISLCGPYGICYPNVWPMCKCLTGFHPRNRNDWELVANTSDGCVRNTELDCHNKTDGFILQSNVKLPDTSASTVDWSTASLDDCKISCLSNCSCTAYARANISSNGRGCILWFTQLTDIKLFNTGSGQDLYVRVAAADVKEAMESSGSHRGVIIVVSSVATLTFLTLVACFIWKRKKTEYSIREEIEEEMINLPSFDFAAIVQATDNFSSSNKLGEGGFGPVYKGRLKETEIAVKRLSKTSEQGADEFKNEVVSIAELQHRNLVRLLGYCIEANERMLLYEYMPNGSLDKFLFDKVKARSLDWKSRYNIILGIARGFLYLHHDSRLRIIHRDLKASNILLDKDMNPKISDFGLAKIFDGNETIRKTRRVVGTYGYMSPEYIKNGTYSVKSDVFSFGVLILEIISSKKNVGCYISTEHLNLLEHIWTLWKEDRVLEAVDELIGSFCVAEVLKCINIGLLCVQEQPKDRPTMSSIVSFLGNDTTQLLEPKRPGFVMPTDPSETNLNSFDPFNHLSITVLEGR